MVSPLPLVGVAPTKRQLGVDSLSDLAPRLIVLPLDEALTKLWETDAHFTTYNVVGSNAQDWPRCNKPVLHRIRARGGDIVTTCFVFDYDNPDHAVWTHELYEKFANKLVGLRDKGFTLPLEFTWFYTTRSGARLVYALRKPIPVDKAERYYRGTLAEFKQHGVLLDERCADWTRLFRLPYVMRDDKPTWEDDFLETVKNRRARFDHRTIKPAEKKQHQEDIYAEIQELDIAKPDSSDAEKWLFEQDSTTTRTQWYRDVKRRLSGRNCYDTLFSHASIASPGGRDSTIHSYVGECIAMVFNIAGTSPELIYALFFKAVEQLEPDDQTPDWTDVLWRAVLKYWAREEAKSQHQKKVAEEDEKDQLTVMEELLAGMREWCNEPALYGSDEDAIQWINEHLIAVGNRSLFLLTPNGYYDSIEVDSTSLIARIRELGMDKLIQLDNVTESGKTTDVTSQTLINRHGTIVSAVEGAIGAKGATIRDIGKDSSTFTMRMFDIKRDLEPVFNPDVDAWLHKLAGDQYYERLCEWIGLALAFKDGPICALSIEGPPGCGKKLLVQGLAECITTEVVADANEMGQFQSLLLRTPFLCINEGFPKLGNGSKDPADSFRSLVGGDPILINPKFKSTVTIRNPLRIIFTANNLECIQVLSGHRDLSPMDRDALAQRLFHLSVSQEASDWLRMKGGLRFTAQHGNRWIRGDDGTKSDYVLAKHFMYLYSIRPKATAGNRLLMEGHLDQDIIRMMTTRSGSAPEVIETLISMVECHNNIEGFSVDNDRIFVTTSGIVSFYEKDLATKRRKIVNTRSVSQVLKGLHIAGRAESYPRVVTMQDGSKRKARWHEVDAGMLLIEAVEHGYASSKLSRIVKNQLKRNRIDSRTEQVEKAITKLEQQESAA